MDAHYLRPALMGGVVMGLALVVALFAIPTAIVPEPEDIGCVLPDHRDVARDTFDQCGGGEPFLVHTHRVGKQTTRFELYPRGEWKRTTDGDVGMGCVDSEGMRELHALLDRATWQREPSTMRCDAAIAGSETWLANGVDTLTYNACDATLPDRSTMKLIEAVLDFEARVEGRRNPACPADALACYEWNIGSLFPITKFVVGKTGAWEITKRDLQSEMITTHLTGTFSDGQVADLRARVDRAPWKLGPWHHDCENYVLGDATVTARGIPIAWSECAEVHPDPTTQAAVDRLFELYRSALGSQPHI